METILLAAIFVIMVLFVIYNLMLLMRINKVYNYRMEIIHKISKQNQKDIMERKPFSLWRYDVFNEVTFRQMVYEFWKPLDSFYPDKHFIGE